MPARKHLRKPGKQRTKKSQSQKSPGHAFLSLQFSKNFLAQSLQAQGCRLPHIAGCQCSHQVPKGKPVAGIAQFLP